MATDPGDGTCSVKIIPHIEAFEDSITEKWYPCTSKGTLEKDIYDAIASKLK
jgi:hypothetical protein